MADDEEETSVTLSFPFPFEGTGYTTVFVGTNGGGQLGDLGDDGEIGYNVVDNLEDFYDDGGSPILLPFSADLDLGTTGTIHFKDFGNRAVFTWNEVGTNEEETHLLSFQLQLFADGRIYFSYNGILDGVGENLLDSLSTGILVGISGSTGIDPGPIDLSTPSSTTTDTLYEFWDEDDAPENFLFDLDMKTLAFSPQSGGGFSVNLLRHVPASPDLLIGKKPNALRGDGIRNPRRPSKRQTITNSGRRLSNHTPTAYLVLQNDGEREGTFTLKSFGARFPRLTVSASVSGSVGNIGAAMKTGRFKPTIPARGSVQVVYKLRTDRLDKGNSRASRKNETVRFQLSGAGLKDNAAMTNRYQ